MSIPKKVNRKLYYSIGEVAKMYDVNTSLIRFWEKEFDIIKPKKNKKGNRLFTPKDVENFNKIYDLVKVKGFTLEGAKKKLKSGYDSDDNVLNQSQNQTAILKLQRVRKELENLLDSL